MLSSDRPCACSFFLPDAAATQRLGQALGELLPAGTVLLLEGNLGSGKTTLTQGIGIGLGITDPIVSPTFTLICEYHEGRIPLYHLDLYRLDAAAVAELNLETYWEGWEYEPGLMAIEWPDRLVYRPDRYLQLTLQTANVSTPNPASSPAPGRLATLKIIGDWSIDWIKIEQILSAPAVTAESTAQNPL